MSSLLARRRPARGHGPPGVLVAAAGLMACSISTSLGERGDGGGGGGSTTGLPPSITTSIDETTGLPSLPPGMSATSGSVDDDTGAETSTTSGTTSGSSTDSGSESETGSSSSSSSSTGEPFLEIVGFRLANADTDVLLGPLVDGDMVDPANYGGAALSLAAEASGPEVGSVVFYVDGMEIRTENIVPFTLGGNIEADLAPWMLTVGEHTVGAQPYPMDNGMGEPGPLAEVTFELQ
ncbi:MAG: hypothetical protein AAF799_29180 [Myxococcota bacterium]